MNTQTSRMIQVEHVTLDKRNHTTQFELQRVDEIVLAELCDPDNAAYDFDTYCEQDHKKQHDNNGHGDFIDSDKCVQCNMPTGTQLQRDDILCDYCADGS